MIFYSGTIEKLDTDGSGYLRRNDRDIARATEEIKRINPAGSTDHLLALSAAYALKPEVIFFLTDADSMTDNDVKELTRLNAQAGRPATIHVVEFGSTKANSLENQLDGSRRRTLVPTLMSWCKRSKIAKHRDFLEV